MPASEEETKALIAETSKRGQPIPPEVLEAAETIAGDSITKFYAADQARDDHGRFEDEGGGEAPSVEVVKSQAASVAHGRGQDSYRKSARYDVKIGGQVRGKIWADKAGYMEKPMWNIATINPDGSGIRSIHLVKSHEAAVEWVKNNHHRFTGK
jgi:hypothetical protein